MGDQTAARYRLFADTLTVSRFPIVLGMVAATAADHVAAYVSLVLLAVWTDMYDGAIARASRIQSRWGANFDSVSDLTFYLAAGACSFAWAPEALVPLIPMILAFTGGYLVALYLSKRRRGVIGYHNRYSRLAASTAVVYAVWLALFGGSLLLTLVIIAIAVTDLASRFWHLHKVAEGRRPSASLAGIHGIALVRRPCSRLRRRV